MSTVHKVQSAHGDTYYACAQHARTGDVLVRHVDWTYCETCAQHARESVVRPAVAARPEWEREGDCCELATRQHCVCVRSTSCPVHGIRCRGSHE